ncbi:amino acid ABC transporter permease [Usitatibacter palustris]|uniref:L-cystine transport system permease protein TcyB n=1 Tax=Usitatibacter palustris TaxID=2732487 RepID=A0A6M4H8I9_9PROT|nr:amino acid ABC transporter permease [Usitatibacter palustris]QJR15891.1 L-cystine transport system permease protein TcyB [Usitatibacter palustris]
MAYTFDFVDVFKYTDVLAKGVAFTAVLIGVGGTLGVAVGIFGAWARGYSRVKALDWIVGAYVELVRNTPFLIQLFFIFFGLPSLGVKLTELQAALIAMVFNLGAYSTEIIRAGIQAIPRGQLEAGASLAMSRIQVFRHVVLRPALQKIWPALSSQLVIVMFGSAVCSQIAVEELTFAANFIQSRNFRAFEVYFVATAVYLGLAILLRQLMRGIGAWFVFGRRAP